jgi:hypothetical protein
MHPFDEVRREQWCIAAPAYYWEIAMRVEVGELSFASAAEAIAHFSDMLNRYGPDDTISLEDTRELLWLLARHPDAAQKRGPGVLGFMIEELPSGARRFRIFRKDYTSTDFSYRKCISKPPAPLAKVSAALRIEVRGDVLDAKRKYFEDHGDDAGRVPCRLTNKLVTIDEADADHAEPYTFHVLVTMFLGALELRVDAIRLEPLEDDQYGRRLLDRDLAAKWRRFHHQHADIRIVAKSEHRSRSQLNRRQAANRQLVLGNLHQPTEERKNG